MRFKNFFLLHERTHFNKTITFVDSIINTIEDQVREKEKINPGDSFTVPIEDFYDLEIKFYKDYSKKARQSGILNKEGKPKALFFDETTDSHDGLIEIYINHSRPYYYRNHQFIAMLNNRLPKFLKDILRHELTHAYEIIIKKLDHPSRSGNIDVPPEQEYDSYLNSDEEVNANFVTAISSAIQHNPLIDMYIRDGRLNDAVSVLLKDVQDIPQIRNLNTGNRKWFVKTAYTTLQKRSETII